MRILVTGGSGKLGRATLTDLAAHGHDLINVDAMVPRDGLPGTFVQADLTDFGEVADIVSHVDGVHAGLDAIVHLAAIPRPGAHSDAKTYRHNAVVSHNVFQAARNAGVKRIVWASSETLLGIPFDSPPPYVPIDEEAPPRPESSYALAKLVDETIAAELCRWDPSLSMIGLRFSNVMEPHDYAAFPGYDTDPNSRKWNLWGYIDARDGAQAIRKALAYDKPGLEIFIIANSDTVMSRPNAELMEATFPGVPFKRPVGPSETLLSIDKARRLLGYEPEFNWR